MRVPENINFRLSEFGLGTTLFVFGMPENPYFDIRAAGSSYGRAQCEWAVRLKYENAAHLSIGYPEGLYEPPACPKTFPCSS